MKTWLVVALLTGTAAADGLSLKAHKRDVDAVAFSPDGRTLAAAASDNHVYLWDVSDPAHPHALGAPLRGPEDTALGVTFSADGRTLFASAGDGTIWMWDVRHPATPSLLATLDASGAQVYPVLAAPSGPYLASSGADRTIRVWDTDPDAVARLICATTGDGITRAEWSQYVQGLPYDPPCANRVR